VSSFRHELARYLAVKDDPALPQDLRSELTAQIRRMGLRFSNSEDAMRHYLDVWQPLIERAESK
jgi:hypothetical protein